MTGIHEHGSTLDGLRKALPYLRLYRGKTFVLKVGGAVSTEEATLRSLAEQIGVLRELGIGVVLVHGAGPQTTALATRLGLETRLVDGRRATDERTLEIAVMTMNGTVNTTLLAAFRAACVPAVGLSGVDAGLLSARRRPPARDAEGKEVDLGQVGDIVAVDPIAVLGLLSSGIVPVVSPLSSDDAGTLFNVNADTVAAAIAGALRAEKLIFLLDQPGILENPADPGSVLSYLDLEGVDRLGARGLISGGMRPKVAAARAALEAGVPRVHLISAFSRDALLREVFTNEGAGTLLVRRREDLTLAELVTP